MSMLWKVGGQDNPVKGSQAPLLCDVSLEIHCLQVLHGVLNTSNTYCMDDSSTKVNFVDPDWELTTADLVHEMAEEYRKAGINIPQNIITKLSSYQMSLGNAGHKNYAIIDDWAFTFCMILSLWLFELLPTAISFSILINNTM